MKIIAELVLSQASFGLGLTMGVYMVALWICNKTKNPLAHPLLVGSILVIAILLLFNIDVAQYQEKSSFISYLLTPATISLAIPVYKRVSILKENFMAILISCTIGMITGLISILLIAVIFQLDNYILLSLLSKSVTTAIAIDITKIIGGDESIIVGSVVLTGIFGVVVSNWIFKIFKINSYFARGLAMGASSHAMGTADSVEKNEIQGAMSSLAMVVCGILIAFLAPITTSILGI